MNPPAALHGAMSRERKPFTYTPGGLDLSQIKSERMAKRLMRNAMNEGVPQLPPQIQSPPAPSTPVAVPNFNCLPVQVFPSFQLPANPKSLLRTRSTPAEHRGPTSRVTPVTPTISLKPVGKNHRETNSITSSMTNVNNNNVSNGRPASMYEYNDAPSHKNNIESFVNSDIKPLLPEISYDAEYFEVKPRTHINQENNGYLVSNAHNKDAKIPIKDNAEVPRPDLTIKPYEDMRDRPESIVNKPVENENADEDNQRGVRIVKKKKVEIQSQNGERNGDAEAELTVQLPVKKSAAKTETKVEVSKKTLPDGSEEEIKTTTTRTTIDGKTEIKTRTEKKIIPKQEDVEEVEEVEEEEEESGDVIVQEIEDNGEEQTLKTVEKKSAHIESVNNIIKNDERSDSTSTTTKKVVIVEQSSTKEEEEKEEDEEEEDDEEPEPVVVKKVEETHDSKTAKEVIVKQELDKEIKKEDNEDEEEDEEEEEVELHEETVVSSEKTESANKEKNEEISAEAIDEEIEEEEQYEEAEEHETDQEPKIKKTEETVTSPSKPKEEEEEESEYTEEEYESEVEDPPKPVREEKSKESEEEVKKEVLIEKVSNEQVEIQDEIKQGGIKEEAPLAPTIPLREPSIPLEKVEEVEIKPIGAATETIKTVRESTETIKGPSDLSTGSLSTQTAYNRIENIVTVNRTTKILDQNYEQLTQSGIPTTKTYFAPERERVSTSPQPAKAYEPLFTTQQQQSQPDRRHSLLLERLSTERQMPSDIYQNQLNNREHQRQWSQEPQSEVVNVSNVKPSSITNSQWYQQTKKENVTYNNVSSSTQSAPSQQWSEPQPQVQPQSQYQPPPPSQPQQLYQQPPAPQYQQSQPQFQQPQPQYQQHQSSYSDQSTQLTSNTYQNKNYTPSTPSYIPSYAPKPTNWGNDTYTNTASNLGTQQNQYSYTNKDSTEEYQKTSQQYSSSYVPPPWEQDPSYVAPELPTQNYYQQSPNTFSPSPNAGWKPKGAGKFPKPAPTAYIPPAPNQSFVKPVSANSEPPKFPGRKTYYSEYERRYISVPESTYVPGDNKLQPDPSPQYYYDNNEPTEAVEHQWRKELREFTEKSSQTQQSEQASVKPPWEAENKYSKASAPAPYTPTPSWSQTLRPQSWRERSFESEFVGSNDWSKTNTVGRGRPLSTYGNPSAETIPQRTRGVSVDRYNPNYYQSPIASEHGPVPTHTLNAPVKGYQNSHLPGHHARASAETRDQAVPSHQPRNWGDQRHSPIQSRSFKYLQWITGTDE